MKLLTAHLIIKLLKEQPKSIEEHFKLILDDEALIDSIYSAVAPTDLPPWFDEKLFKKFVPL